MSVRDLSLLASLDLEVAQFATYNVKIKEVSLTLDKGEVVALVGTTDFAATYKPGDQLTFTYKIKPELASDGTPALGSKGHFLTLNIKANVFVTESCQPDIAIEWKTPVDFANEQDPSVIKAAYRLSNPSSQDSRAPKPDSLPSHDTQAQQEQDASNNNINITLTVSGPPRVRVGELFTWDVFMVNRSDKTRKLAVLVVAKRKRDYERHISRPSSSSVGASKAVKQELLAPAVIDENIVYARQKSARTETAELVCLTTDIRLGSVPRDVANVRCK